MRTTIALLLLFPFTTLLIAKEAAPSGIATIHLYRNPTFAASLVKFKIKVNGKKVKVRNGYWYDIEVPIGSVTLRNCSTLHDELTMEVDENKEYYIRSFVRLGYLIGIEEMAEVTERNAKHDLQEFDHRRVAIDLTKNNTAK